MIAYFFLLLLLLLFSSFSTSSSLTFHFFSDFIRSFVHAQYSFLLLHSYIHIFIFFTVLFCSQFSSFISFVPVTNWRRWRVMCSHSQQARQRKVDRILYGFSFHFIMMIIIIVIIFICFSFFFSSLSILLLLSHVYSSRIDINTRCGFE